MSTSTMNSIDSIAADTVSPAGLVPIDSASTIELVENFNALVSLYKGQFIDESELRNAYCKVFDKAVIALTPLLNSKLSADNKDEVEYVELTFEDLYRNCFLKWKEAYVTAEFLEMKVHEEGYLEYKIRAVRDNVEGIYENIAFVRDGKIVRVEGHRVEKKELPRAEPVSGQAHVYSETHIPGLPSEKTLVAKLVDLPNGMKGKLLGEGTDMKPSQEEGEVVRVILEHNRVLVRRNGKITIHSDGSGLYAGGAYLYDHRRPFNQACFVLKDKEDSIVALTIQDRHKLNRAYFVCGKTPLNPGDQPLTKQGTQNMYPWYRVENFRDGPIQKRVVSIFNGKDYNRVIVARPHAWLDKGIHPHELHVDKGHVIFSSLDGKQNYGLLSRTSEGSKVDLHLTIAPGVDPVLLICVSAVLEDFIGSND